MTKKSIINNLKKYFQIYELVDEEVYSIYGERAWRFFSTDLLHCLLIIRKEANASITINDWYWGGKFTQRGLRHNLSPLVKGKKRPYLSPHVMGLAFDFDIKGKTAIESRMLIHDIEALLPCKFRLERNMNGKPINWVHFDVVDDPKNPKLYQFDV